MVTKGKLGAIACPPQLLVTPPATHALHVLHYESDHLCVWKPGQRQGPAPDSRTYVRTEDPAYKESSFQFSLSKVFLSVSLQLERRTCLDSPLQEDGGDRDRSLEVFVIRFPSAMRFFWARSSPALETSWRGENSEIESESGRSFFSPPGSASKLSSDKESSEISKTLLFPV